MTGGRIHLSTLGGGGKWHDFSVPLAYKKRVAREKYGVCACAVPKISHVLMS